MSEVIEITDAEFKTELTDGSEFVLAYFWATWCGPCRLVSPTIKWAAETYSERLKVLKLEVDPNPETVSEYKVEGVPALRLFKNQDLIYSHEGAIGKQGLQEVLESNLN